MIQTLLSMDPWLIASFVAAGIVLNLTPGADVLFASASGISGGPKAGIAASAGISLGSLFHVTLAAVGVAALLAAYPSAFDAVRYAGAAYLLYLAVKSWRTAPDMEARGTQSMSRAMLRGFITNALNPKVALFILALLPQFTDPAAGPIWHQILILGALFSTTGFFITAGYGVLAGVLGTALKRHRSYLNKLSSLVFSALALKLITD